MKVLLTGAFGNIGKSTLDELFAKDNTPEIRCFDVRNQATEQVAAEFAGKVEVHWGDITDAASVRAAVDGVDHIIHLAAIIPPLVDQRPEWAYAINVTGTKHLIDAAEAQDRKPVFVFTSSIATYGPCFHKEPPRRADEELNPTDNYGRHKVECEEMLRASGLEWSILRLGAVPPVSTATIDPIMFELNLDGRVEFVHTRDVGLALANTVGNERIVGKTFLIGGGPDGKNQYYYRDFLGDAYDAMGIGRLPAEAFGTEYFYTDWMDTAESQEILQYQRYSFPDWIQNMVELLGWRIIFIRMFRPLIRWYILRMSPYWKNRNKDGTTAATVTA